MQENKSDEESQSPETLVLPKTFIVLMLLFGAGIVAGIIIFSMWGDNQNQKAAAAEEKKQFIEKGINVGADGSDAITSLFHTGTGKSAIYETFTEAGEAAIFNDSFELQCRGDNPTVDMNAELPRSILTIAPLGNNLYVGGTANGQVNLYTCVNSKFVVKQVIDDFKSGEISDPIAGSGSVTNIFASPGKTRLLAINYDGLGRVYSVSGSEIRIHSTFQLTAAVVAGACLSENEVWTVTADGRVSAFNIDQMAKPAIEFDVSNFGRIRGADYAGGKFLVFGHSLDVKTASVAVYDRTGKLLEILTKGGVSKISDQAPAMPAPNTPLDEMPRIQDLGESFADAKWLGDNLIGAVKDNQFYFLDLNGKKVTGVELPLKPLEESRQFIRTGENTFVIGTSGGRVFERKIVSNAKSE